MCASETNVLITKFAAPTLSGRADDSQHRCQYLDNSNDIAGEKKSRLCTIPDRFQAFINDMIKCYNRSIQ